MGIVVATCGVWMATCGIERTSWGRDMASDEFENAPQRDRAGVIPHTARSEMFSFNRVGIAPRV